MRKLSVFLIPVFLFLAFGGGSVSALSLSAKAAALINGDTGEMIFEKNAGERLPMASTTKIMTALLLCEEDLSKEITVTDEMIRVEGSSMGLKAGDRVSYRDLLYGMLLSSGNDAANVTAFALAGSLDAFAERMNAKADALGLRSTHFVTPSGLDANEHYTTAADLAYLTRAALQNEDFAKAAATESVTLTFGTPPEKHTLINHNKLLKISEDVIGVKTGFTKRAGRCLVSAAKRDGKFVIAVTLCDPDDWSDHEALLEYGFNAVKPVEYCPENAPNSVPVIGGISESVGVEIAPYRGFTEHPEKITATVELPKFLYAPLKQGDKVGEIRYYLGEQKIGSAPVTLISSVAVSQKRMSFLERMKQYLARLCAGLGEI